MLNSINGGTSFVPEKSVSGLSANSIAGQADKKVTVDGETYKVEKKVDNSVFSIMPTYEEVVTIDGEEYRVKEVSDPFACDKTKQVIIKDGKQYDVYNGFSVRASIESIFN